MNSLYIHIPFCKSKCHYCDFVSYAGKEELIEKYIDSLILSLDSARDILLPRGEGLATVYFGGGTPSLLSPTQLNRILSSLTSHLSSHAEISLEANPATADYEKLKAFRELGVNRLSVGAQTFIDKHLKVLGRIHSAEDIYQFYNDARRAGFTNIGIDLIFALPNQTFSEWKKDVEEVLKFNPEHISIYNLEIKKKSHLSSLVSHLPDNDTEADMFEFAIESLKQAGYKHYEISNFAKPGFKCQHNLAYWQNKNYLGIGTGAHSHINKGSAADRQETIFMGLRLIDGIEKEKFEGFEKEVAELINDGLLKENGKNYKLTQKGIMLGNLAFAQFV
ncbi:radical SAM family heme chaperone HemW [Candidatus Margulisiibacteriota bacterium]